MRLITQTRVPQDRVRCLDANLGTSEPGKIPVDRLMAGYCEELARPFDFAQGRYPALPRERRASSSVGQAKLGFEAAQQRSARRNQELHMSQVMSKSHTLGMSVVIGSAVGILAALLSAHVTVWLIAGILLGIAAGALFAQKKCPACEARAHGGSKLRTASGEQGADG